MVAALSPRLEVWIDVTMRAECGLEALGPRRAFKRALAIY
jgi:hypothetical protein